MDFVALDLEIADRRNEAPCSLALVLVQDGKITKEKQILIDPETEFNPFAIRVHGITPRQVAGCPTFPDIWPQLSAIFQKYPVVAHNAAFDISVLKKAAARYQLPFEPPMVYCTMRHAKLNYDFPSYSLDSLCSTFHIDLPCHHDSLYDARACARLMLKYLDDAPPIYPIADTATPKNKPGKKNSIRISDIIAQCDCIDATNPLYGCKIVFTGELSIPRDRAMQIAVDRGAEIKSSVSRLTDILVVGSQDPAVVGCSGQSAKERKAAELNASGQAHILIINETRFLALANNEVNV